MRTRNVCVVHQLLFAVQCLNCYPTKSPVSRLLPLLGSLKTSYTAHMPPSSTQNGNRWYRQTAPPNQVSNTSLSSPPWSAPRTGPRLALVPSHPDGPATRTWHFMPQGPEAHSLAPPSRRTHRRSGAAPKPPQTPPPQSYHTRSHTAGPTPFLPFASPHPQGSLLLTLACVPVRGHEEHYARHYVRRPTRGVTVRQS